MNRKVTILIVLIFLLLPFCKKGGGESNLNLPTILSFYADPATIYYGGSTVISWNVSNAFTVVISPVIGNVTTSGSIELTDFTSDIVFTLTAMNNDGAINRSLNITVKPGPLLLLAKEGVKGKLNGFLTFFGWILNDGNANAYNVFVEGWAEDANGIVLDYSNTLTIPSTIPPGVVAEFQLQFPFLSSWKKVANIIIKTQCSYSASDIIQKFKYNLKNGDVQIIKNDNGFEYEK